MSMIEEGRSRALITMPTGISLGGRERVLRGEKIFHYYWQSRRSRYYGLNNDGKVFDSTATSALRASVRRGWGF